MLVLAQRGNLRKVHQSLGDRERAAKVLALRLAVIFTHARRSEALPRLTLKSGRSMELALDGDWLSRHPLTQYLLEEEAAHWARIGMTFNVRALQAA